MSHGIRTPIAGMIGLLELLNMGTLDDNQRDWVQSMRNNAESLLPLINGILDFSRIEAKKAELDETDFNLMTLLENIMDVQAVNAHEKNLDFGCIIDRNVPIYLNGNAGKLKQILNNLLGNAIKFTSRGEVHLNVFAGTQEDTGETDITFQVRDSGIGIPARVLPTLFESYTQAGGGVQGRFGGTRLGLNITREVNRLLQGSIEVESTEQKGAVFTVMLKFHRGGKLFPGAPGIENMRVLYGDPGDVNRKALVELGLRWGR